MFSSVTVNVSRAFKAVPFGKNYRPEKSLKFFRFMFAVFYEHFGYILCGNFES